MWTPDGASDVHSPPREALRSQYELLEAPKWGLRNKYRPWMGPQKQTLSPWEALRSQYELLKAPKWGRSGSMLQDFFKNRNRKIPKLMFSFLLEKT